MMRAPALTFRRFCRAVRHGLPLLLAALLLTGAGAAQGAVVVIGHPALPRLDDATLKKIYSGRIIELNGINIVPVNAGAGSALQQRFMTTYMDMEEAKYIAYWTVRRFIGKGTPPREISGPAEIIGFVQSTPGAIAYIDDTDLKPGISVLLRK